MSFAQNYFGRFKTGDKIFNTDPCSNTGIIVVIPCYNDSFIFETLNSLNEAKPASVKTEVIVIVNSGENTPEEIVNINRDIFEKLQVCQETEVYNNFKLLIHLIENTPKKFAGVGNARKTGMDEAVHRFNSIEKPDGIIISLDADCLVSKNYFESIENYYSQNKKSGACTLQFKHDFDTDKFDNNVIDACKLYEIYLRYFRLSLKFCEFPYPLHTIGSCFSVKAESYIKAGGMSQRQGGEDFYFLHKLAPMTTVGTISETLVFPSPRISDRVPFGTGPAVNKIINENQFLVYNFELFQILKKFYSNFESIYDSKSNFLSAIPMEIIHFTDKNTLETTINECRQNTNNLSAFIKRLFSKFDAFFAIRFLNSFDTDSNFPPIDVITACTMLFHALNIDNNYQTIDEYYDAILLIDK